MILTMGYPSLRHQENAVKSGNAGCCGCWPDTQSRCALLGEDNGFAAKATPEDGGTRLERSPSVALTRAIWGPLSLRYGWGSGRPHGATASGGVAAWRCGV